MTNGMIREDEGFTPIGEEAIPLLLGRNLRRLRVRQGLSLERLARLSGVSRAMLGQIELGRSVPTVTVLWKVARALDVSFTTLISFTGHDGIVVMRHDPSQTLLSADGNTAVRTLTPSDGDRRVEFRELVLRAGALENGVCHQPGTMQNIVVANGQVELSLAGRRIGLGPRDAILFDADLHHDWRNVGDDDATLYMVVFRQETAA